MLIETFTDDPARLNAFKGMTSDLLAIGAYAMLLELAAQRNIALPSNNPIEDAALRGAWHNGYIEALADLFLFKERYVDSVNRDLPKPDFNAPSRMLEKGEIRADEYAELTGQQPASDR